MQIFISKTSSDPLYLQIVQQIQKQIISGAIPAGEPLPSIRTLALDLQLSVITTKRAYEELGKSGYINTVKGKGCFIAEQNRELMQERRRKIVEDKLAEVVEWAQILGINETEIIEIINLFFNES